jgi:hypothetical protein
VAELAFLDDPDSAETRRIILDELARVQAQLSPEAEQTFEWWGTPHWIDRKRKLVLRVDDVKKFVGLATLPPIPETEELLRFYGGADRYVDVIAAVDMLSWLVSGTLAQHSWLPSTTVMMNVLMVQPVVNPAFSPLSWVALSRALDDAEGPDNLMSVAGPMAYDMARYPASRADAPAVRRAQADYVRAASSNPLPDDWATLDDVAWAAVCNRLVGEYQYQIEPNVFRTVTERADRIRRGVDSM